MPALLTREELDEIVRITKEAKIPRAQVVRMLRGIVHVATFDASVRRQGLLRPRSLKSQPQSEVE
jgi:hypothetical protein